MCLLRFYCFSELLEADLSDFLLNGRCDVKSRTREMTRSINVVAWPVHQRWKVSDEDQRRRRNNWVSVKPGTPRNTPGTPRNIPGTPRNTPEQPRNTPGTSHNTPEHPRNSKEHPRNNKNSGQRSDCSRID